jgi:ADP-heptose:LPS heptosyltransferase
MPASAPLPCDHLEGETPATPRGDLLAEARDILVFRALVLGDLLCATPALRALRLAAPQARITLCSLPWAAALAARLPMVDAFIEFPGHPDLPERRPAPGALDRFVDDVRSRSFDLVLQMHGSGSIVNPLVTALGGRRSAGFATPGTEAGLDLAVPWPVQGTEVDRCLALAQALGAPGDGPRLAFPLSAADRLGAAVLLRGAGVDGPFAIVHPGSQLPSRRWPPARFAAVADALSDRGLHVVVTGSPAEAPLAAAVRAASRRPPVDLCGRTDTIWLLGALVASASLVVANDTGISHVAAALGVPSVIVASGSDVARWAPHDRARHRVLWHATPCRPCAHAVCPTQHECAAGVLPQDVAASALDLLESVSP